jgi:hypothetical protein
MLEMNIVHRDRCAELSSEGHDEFGISRAVGTQVMVHVVDVEREAGPVRQEGHPDRVGTTRNGQRNNAFSCREDASLEEFASHHVVTIRLRMGTSF